MIARKQRVATAWRRRLCLKLHLYAILHMAFNQEEKGERTELRNRRRRY